MNFADLMPRKINPVTQKKKTNTMENIPIMDIVMVNF